MNRIYNYKTNNKVNTSKPPLGPPLRIIKCSIFGERETKESILNTKSWHSYIKEYRVKTSFENQ